MPHPVHHRTRIAPSNPTPPVTLDSKPAEEMNKESDLWPVHALTNVTPPRHCPCPPIRRLAVADYRNGVSRSVTFDASKRPNRREKIASMVISISKRKGANRPGSAIPGKHREGAVKLIGAIDHVLCSGVCPLDAAIT